jgi:pimeloyl-ACP methyl ester carboxylesterase
MGVEGAFRGGSGEPLLLVHGFSSVPLVWRPVVGDLEGSFDVLAVALAGHVGGPSLPAGAPVCMQAIVDAVEREMDAAGFETAHIAGNSLGGWIALELASRGRARTVVALSPAGGWEQGTAEERRLRGIFRRNHAIAQRMLPHAHRLLSRPRLRRALLAGAMARADRLDPSEALAMIEGSVECPIYFDLMGAIERDGPPANFAAVSCPVLLAWGTKDRLLPAARYSQRMRNLLPAAHWMDLPGLGHMPMGDDPQLIASVIAGFAAQAGGGAHEEELVAQALA